ncbi:precorrin-6A/cobalt-precorrin-6A reductase [Pedobacter sp. L105]|uniref:precorrin-6A/cobalt-precorrin-6A reductase n=1 Tax=Pedobacter sp. L105 TaxID=1641871 RepID=UPI00131B5176|nr:precorrin-6A/cobalt-precorrin-6A reductase [Pedobacter sp. L105]
MILLLGGTTEAKQAAAWLEEAGLEYIYSTRTEVKSEGKGKYRYGSLTVEGIKEFCGVNGISYIIDACHPFAKELHATAASLASEIPVIRFEREFSKRIKDPLVHYVDDYAAALIQIKQLGYQSMLALTGVQSIPHLSSFWQDYPCWFRILDREYSIDFAARYHFPEKNLLFGLPQEKSEEIELFNRLKPEVIITKESGLNGRLNAKTEAAIACHIPIFILIKPELSALFKVVHNRQELLNSIQ